MFDLTKTQSAIQYELVRWSFNVVVLFMFLGQLDIWWSRALINYSLLHKSLYNLRTILFKINGLIIE